MLIFIAINIYFIVTFMEINIYYILILIEINAYFILIFIEISNVHIFQLERQPCILNNEAK